LLLGTRLLGWALLQLLLLDARTAHDRYCGSPFPLRRSLFLLLLNLVALGARRLVLLLGLLLLVAGAGFLLLLLPHVSTPKDRDLRPVAPRPRLCEQLAGHYGDRFPRVVPHGDARHALAHYTHRGCHPQSCLLP